MSRSVLAVLVLGPTAAVVAALFIVLWRERRSRHDALVALVSGGVLAVWGTATAVLADRGAFQPPDGGGAPPVGVALASALIALGLCLSLSPSLRRLLTRQSNLILLNVWRLEGVVFLTLMALGQLPAIWALPAGLGDVLVGASAPWIARRLDSPRGRRRAITFNVLGLADLIVAVGLGIMVNPGPAQVFHTSPSAELLTQFPLALVPTFLVPLAVTLHVVSLWQLLGGAWMRSFVVERRRVPRGTTSPSFR
jgi:hypothetical protein